MAHSTDTYDTIVARLRQEFLDEALERVQTIEKSVADVHFGKLSHADAIITIRRQAHNLKGMGSSFQFPIIALIAHRLEDYISDFSEIDRRHANDIEKYVDALRNLLEQGLSALTPVEEERSRILRSLPVRWTDDVLNVPQHDVEVLLITPSRVGSRLVERELRACGFRVIASNNAMEGLELGVRMKPDLIVASAVMEDISGIDMARAFHAMRATTSIPFALLTSFDRDNPALSELPSQTAIVRIGSYFSDDLAEVITHFNIG